MINDAVKSALAQKDVSLEVLVVDDVSTDTTPAVVESFARSDPRVRLIRAEKRGGCGAARNIAIDQAKGDWVAILDADDWYREDRLSLLLNAARDWDADMVADNVWLVDDATRRPFDTMLSREHINAPRQISAEAFVQNSQPKNVKRKYGLLKPIIRRELLDRHAIRYNEETPYGEDFLLCIECLVRGAKFVLLPEAYYFYELSGKQMTRKTTVAQAESFLEHCDALLHREDIRSTPGLATALTERSAQLRADFVYMRFKAAIKSGRLFEAASIILSSPDRAAYIVRHINRSAMLRLRQWWAGKANRAADQAATALSPKSR